MKFNIDDYNDSYVMHCPTEEAADIFLSYLDSIGKQWRTGKRYIEYTNWLAYNSETCYRFTQGTFGSLSKYLSEEWLGVKIVLEFNDFDWDYDSIDIDEETIAIFEQFLGNFQITS